jgi:hypothetical protein
MTFTAELAASRRLSRFLYLAERPAGAAPGNLPVV